MSDKIVANRFSYLGPKEPYATDECELCVSSRAKMCLSKRGDAGHKTETCGLCAAAASGVCSAHGLGVGRVLDQHQASLVGQAKDMFTDDRAFIDAKLALIPSHLDNGQPVFVRVTVNESINVEGGPAVVSSIEVIQAVR